MIKNKKHKIRALWSLMFPDNSRPDIPFIPQDTTSPSEPVPPQPDLQDMYTKILGKTGVEVAPDNLPSRPKRKEDEDEEEIY